ncbi:TetR/AcrR family transcriptional regulator [Chrysiogenes arsenatis]|uniref:TetR/AcrR family transcriptional regulator n=1 Tax=Chrysiogenes arsenatis TaxID=309797 RepID=UPI0003FE9EC0|nr:TetR/AcrR family transcriptional regulator [Chrysiogenes arsenatis]
MARRKPNKREILLRSALELFSENGFHGTPISQIAGKAGVGVGTIYRYFAGKDELIQELFQELFVKISTQINQGIDDALPIRERFIALFGRLLSHFINEPRQFRFMEQYYYSPYAQHKPEEVGDHERIRLLLQTARNSGIFKDLPLPVMESIAFGPIVALAKEHLSGRFQVNDHIANETVLACWDALVKR